ncbi:hypothetical protein D9758_012731 [Tetrapyrgos nigripes]|uniref:RING-type domain-containing protein n=1 Tax=Tetrapyrgos nigripes TaxID=182062 RepID=A0A8H5FTE0_9AGAR|nr:hypothetical protein D9758_012731 [Tetrapyrgos nigripes]
MQPVIPKLLGQIQDLRQGLPHNERVVAMRQKTLHNYQRMDIQLQGLEEELRGLPERQIDPALEKLKDFRTWNLDYRMNRLAGRIGRTPSWFKRPLKRWYRERMEILEFAMNGILGMVKELEGEKNQIPQPLVVRYLPPPPASDISFNSSPPPDWLAMFVPSEVPSICIEDYNACCNICCEDFEPPRLNEEDQEDDEDLHLYILFQLPCQHVLHEKCLKDLDGNICPTDLLVQVLLFSNDPSHSRPCLPHAGPRSSSFNDNDDDDHTIAPIKRLACTTR